MTARLDPFTAAPALMKHWMGTSLAVAASLETDLVHLVEIRASQINGCAYCVDMHIKHAREDGLGQQWIDLLSVWQESPLYSDAERALLGWTEALTLLAETRAPDHAYDALRRHFSEEEATKLTVAIGLINVWNRVAVGFRTQHPIDAAGAAQ